MGPIELYIDGNNFSNLDGFYDEVEKQLTSGLDWKIGRNLDAFNDVLRGGFGKFEYEEPIKLIWKNSEKSKKELGYEQMISRLQELLKTCHPSNISIIEKEIQDIKTNHKPSLFDTILDIIRSHSHIELILR
jgi:RNAse (barnase) inhibitor barstar